MRIIYSTIYLRRIHTILTAEEQEAIENSIAANPTIHPVIQGTGGIRKARAARSGKGKRGGARVIFYFWQSEAEIFMLTVYAKKEQEDLTPGEKKQLKALVDKIKEQQKE
jgi:hypothetical protein